MLMVDGVVTVAIASDEVVFLVRASVCELLFLLSSFLIE